MDAPKILIPLALLRVNPDNPRVILDTEFLKTKRSLACFAKMLHVRGLAAKKQDDGTWVVFGGNTRLTALQQLEQEIESPEKIAAYGADKDQISDLSEIFKLGVPCHNMGGFTDAEIERFIVQDNINFGDWNFDALKQQYNTEILQQYGLSENDLRLMFSDTNVNHRRDDEWIGMPSFETKSNTFRIIIHFEDADEREKFANHISLPIRKKELGAWSTVWPYAEYEDLKSLRYE
jgi:hypothetical protein